MWYINGTRLDDRIIRTDWDAGFVEGRQFGRGKSGGQVRTSRSFLTNHLGLCQADCCILKFHNGLAAIVSLSSQVQCILSGSIQANFWGNTPSYYLHAVWQVAGKNKKYYAELFEGKCGICVNFAEKTLDYAEISTVDKIDNKAFLMYWTKVKQKALQILTTV